MSLHLKTLITAFFIASLSLSSILAFSPACLDPAGCVVLRPGTPIIIAIESISSGLDQDKSEEMVVYAQQAVKLLPPIQNHPIELMLFYSSCFPDGQSQSAIQIAADARVVAVISPVCQPGVEGFLHTMNQVGKTIIPLNLSSNLSAADIRNTLENFSGGLNAVAIQSWDGSLLVPREKLANFAYQIINP
jgi:hypothetical protein